MSQDVVGTREIGRYAVRAELARVAFNQFCMTGFDRVTFADLSEAAGVSRSTFLRYFGTKEDVVLFVFDPVGDVIVEALDAAREDECDWTRLRTATQAAVTFLRRGVPELPAVLTLIGKNAALQSRLREKRAEWRTPIAARLRETSTEASASAVIDDIRVASALECLWIVLEQWNASDGVDDPNDLLDAAFAAFTTVQG